MVKTIAIIFVKENDLGKILIGEDLQKFLVLHNQAVTAYKKANGMVETVKGPLVHAEIDTISTTNLTKAELLPAINRILLCREDGSIILLQDMAFTNYWNIHSTGLELLTKDHQGINGVFAWIKISK